MSNPVPETEPSAEDVLQHEAPTMPVQAVPVAVDGPVNVRALPSPTWAVASAAPIDATGSQQLLGVNPTRKRATIVANAAPAHIAPSKGQADSRSVGLIPTGVPIVIEHIGEVWVNNVAAGTPVVTAIVEHWTE
jgi:hypothetical protein